MAIKNESTAAATERRRITQVITITPQHVKRLKPSLTAPKYCGHIEREGEEFVKLACEHDLEGIVAKHRFSPYIPDSQPGWLKIRNTDYSQWVGREELFERERAIPT
jgi:ATP-dependent DNA ligase